MNVEAEPLNLRPVDHPIAREAQRFIWNEIEVGSLGLQAAQAVAVSGTGGIDTLAPPPQDSPLTATPSVAPKQ